MAALSSLTLALSKGILLEPSVKLLKKSGYDASKIKEDSRKLVINSGDIRCLLCRPSDVTTYVEYGAADVGITGKDALLESGRNVFELCNLGFGWCRFIVAVPEKREEKIKETYRKLGQITVATKYAGYAEEFFARKGIQAEIIKLRGSVELAPAAGLADVIFDLTTTGKTLKQNKLTVIDEGCECTARLIANWVSNKIKSSQIQALAGKMIAAAKKSRYL